jgi:prevent-host-death family protein
MLYSRKVERVNASKARAILPEILDRVEAGEEITIVRHGRAIAVVVSPASLRSRKASEAFGAAARVRATLDQARSLPLPSQGLSLDRADALVNEIEAARTRS